VSTCSSVTVGSCAICHSRAATSGGRIARAESQREANQAGKLAGAVSTAADAKMATPEAVARAREEADKKDARVPVGAVA
jgi:hypothetical protein